MNHYIILTEGSQDISVVSKLLEINDFSEIKTVKKLEAKSLLFKKLIPKNFPFNENKFKVWNIIPKFYLKDEKIILLINPEGQDNILNRIKEYFESLELTEIEELTKILIILDADNCQTREEKIDGFCREFDNLKINKNDYREMFLHKYYRIDSEDKIEIPLAIFILPDDKSCGTLENLLVETIEASDKELYDKLNEFFEENRLEFSTEAERMKALISCVGGILVPKGYSTAMNILDKDVNWIRKESLDLPCLATLDRFLKTELES